MNTETVWRQEGQVTGDKPGRRPGFRLSLSPAQVGASTWQAHNQPGANPGAHLCCARCPAGHRDMLIRNLPPTWEARRPEVGEGAAASHSRFLSHVGLVLLG